MTNSAGGAATNAGVEFQQRVSAWFATAMLKGLDVAFVFECDPPFVVDSMSWETASSIDDLLLSSKERSIFVQVKRSLDLSAAETSEFRSVLNQFTTRFISHGGAELYTLIVSPLASRSVSYTLQKLLLSIRLDEKGYAGNPRSKQEAAVLTTFRQGLEASFLDLAKRPITENEFIQLCKRMRIVSMAVEANAPEERAALILLQSIPRVGTSAQLVWSAVIAQCLRFATGRVSCTREPLESIVFATLPPPVQERLSQEEGITFEAPQMVSSWREVILGTLPENPKDLLLMELLRFNKDGSRRTRFDGQTCTLKNGMVIQLHRRASTVAGIERYLKENASQYKEYTLGIVESRFSGDPSLSPHAEAHGLQVAKMLHAQQRKLLCIVCGAPVSTRNSEVVEIDESSRPHQAGIVHSHCVLPSFRILGRPEAPLFDAYPLLVNFDVQLWIEKLRRGQGGLSLLASRSMSGMTIAWDPNYQPEQFGLCVRFELENGSYRYATKRGKVQRFRKAEGDAVLALIVERIAESVKRGDPLCYTEAGDFGPLSTLIKLGPGKAYERVLRADLVPFNVEIGRLNDLYDNHYAPLCVLRTLSDEEEITFADHIFLISDPLALGHFIKNWRDAGLNIDQFRVDVIADDVAFDAFMRNVTRQGRAAVIDPLLSPNGDPLSGTLITPLPEFV